MDYLLAVVEQASTHDFSSRRAMFLIDGDFFWVRGEAEPLPHGVHRLDAYCIENLLFDHAAAARILADETGHSDTDAATLMRFHEWCSTLADLLLPLGCLQALCNQLLPDEATVSRLPGIVLDVDRDGTSMLSASKVAIECARLRSLLATVANADQIALWEDRLITRARSLPEPLRVVTGKDLLLLLLQFRLQELSNGRCKKMARPAMRMRLASHCDIERFDTLRAALVHAAR